MTSALFSAWATRVCSQWSDVVRGLCVGPSLCTAMSRRFQLPPILTCLITVLISGTASADTPDCPYPCLPPPSAAGAINSYPPPQPSTGGGGGLGGSFPPPPPGSFQLTPPGAIPAGFSPPYSGFPSGPAPPPPNPVLPWFPWYYQRTNPITGSTTSASSPAMDARSTTLTVAVLFHLSLLVLVRVL